MQRLFFDYVQLLVLPDSGLVRNISLSIIHLHDSLDNRNSKYSDLDDDDGSSYGYDNDSGIDWVIDPTGPAVNEQRTTPRLQRRELLSRAITHAFTSRTPRASYWIGRTAAGS